MQRSRLERRDLRRRVYTADGVCSFSLIFSLFLLGLFGICCTIIVLLLPLGHSGRHPRWVNAVHAWVRFPASGFRIGAAYSVTAFAWVLLLPGCINDL